MQATFVKLLIGACFSLTKDQRKNLFTLILVRYRRIYFFLWLEISKVDDGYFVAGAKLGEENYTIFQY